MKRKMVMLLTGSILALACAAGSAQAMTYGYDLGNGSSVYYFAGEAGGKTAGQTAREAVKETTGQAAGETAGQTSAVDAAQQTEEERRRAEAWYKASMQEAVAYVEKYGVSYDAENDRLLYEGKTVRWLIDEQIDDCYEAIHMPEGEIDLYTVRDEDYTLTGVRIATQEEYDERTREDELAEKQVYAVTPGTASENRVYSSQEAASEGGENAAYHDIVIEEKPERGVLYTWSTDEGLAVDSVPGNAAQSEKSDVVYSQDRPGSTTEENGTAYSQDRPGSTTEENGTAYSQDGPEKTAVAQEDGDGSWTETEEEKQKAAEYEKAGITRSSSGGWLWNGQAIYFLLDEDGGLSVNNTSETADNKIYVLVKRNEDGSIKEVKQVTDEEVLKAKVQMDK
ncbi:hypothetical protein [Marvinbryantia formatexigens]|nr:hypothetical protein [Marvinbryantia formatexigens]UWO25670.1 hypothetical protein NQ534_04105 [Marvinbryantia formatexigens DSM 14469]SDF32333.1 hypothetical protein SAMN05660368_00471 [Marvinbryantia formatexigens]